MQRGNKMRLFTCRVLTVTVQALLTGLNNRFDDRSHVLVGVR